VKQNVIVRNQVVVYRSGMCSCSEWIVERVSWKNSVS